MDVGGDSMGEFFLIMLSILISVVLELLVVTFFSKLICWCFGFGFSWKIALGIYLIFLLFKNIFKTSK